MARLDHVALETTDPDRAASFYERFLGARVVRTEGHPVMAYTDAGALALHKAGGPGDHVAFRVREEDRVELARRLDAAGIEHEERDHEIAVGLFFRDPDGRLVEAITYRGGDDPRR
jgi:catechol 2,3-dioxygenase-like lactoylglutathione lyase family enzyme